MFFGILWELSLQNKPNCGDNMSTEIKQKSNIQQKDGQKYEEYKEISFDNF